MERVSNEIVSFTQEEFRERCLEQTTEYLLASLQESHGAMKALRAIIEQGKPSYEAEDLMMTHDGFCSSAIEIAKVLHERGVKTTGVDDDGNVFTLRIQPDVSNLN